MEVPRVEIYGSVIPTSEVVCSKPSCVWKSDIDFQKIKNPVNEPKFV